MYTFDTLNNNQLKYNTMKTATAKDVHNEFGQVSQTLLQEATRIVGKANKKENDLTIKMKQLGFGNSVSIKDDAKTIEDAQKTLSLNILYPQNNFLTEKMVENICKKYGLLMANSADFIGAIPVKNQMEIASFKMAEVDQFVKVIDRKKFSENIQKIKDIKKKKGSFFRKASSNYSFLSDMRDGMMISSYKSNYHRTMPKREFLSRNNSNLSFRSEVKPEFMIVATPDNFNMENREVVGEYMLVDKDPVVLCKVNGGYLQVSAWGDETNMDEFKTAAKN